MCALLNQCTLSQHSNGVSPLYSTEAVSDDDRGAANNHAVQGILQGSGGGQGALVVGGSTDKVNALLVGGSTDKVHASCFGRWVCTGNACSTFHSSHKHNSECNDCNSALCVCAVVWGFGCAATVKQPLAPVRQPHSQHPALMWPRPAGAPVGFSTWHVQWRCAAFGLEQNRTDRRGIQGGSDSDTRTHKGSEQMNEAVLSVSVR
jgi:hypothetical protein